MGIHVIKMPDIGEGIAEVELTEWHVKPGDMVVEDQSLADVMTDKANVEIPTPVAGKVLALGGKPGDVMAVGSELIRIEVEGEGNVRGADAAAVTVDTPQPAVARKQAVETPAPPDTPPPSADARSPAVASETPGVATNAATSPSGGSEDARSPTRKSDAPKAASAKPHIPASAAQGIGKRAKPLAAPAVRQRAANLGIDLQRIRGSGPDGRITHQDLDAELARGAGATAARDPRPGRDAQSASSSSSESPAALSAASSSSAAIAAAAARGAQYAERNDEESVPVIGLRRKIAQKMQESKRRIPHFTYVEEVDVTELEALRVALNDEWSKTRGKLTLLPFLMRAIVRTVPDFPQVNARFDDDAGTVTRHGAVHLGIATQTDGGLVVPVVRHAEALDLWSCAAELARLADAARGGKATRDELSGSTLTITSLGALGGIVTTPVINHPEVAIVGVNRIVERPVIRSGAIVPRALMNLSSSFDHRVVDGMDAARFVQALRRRLEHPALLFID